LIDSQRILLRSVSRSLRRYATPRATIEAIMHSVRVRQTGALHEPANIGDCRAAMMQSSRKSTHVSKKIED
jgi:hypothetical protein